MNDVAADVATPKLAEIVARKRARALDEASLATLLAEAHTANAFLPVPVERELLARIVRAAGMGPTSGNSQPMRLTFVESSDAKARLVAMVSPGNVDKTLAAPVTAIVAADLRFYEHLGRLYPQSPDMAVNYAKPERAVATRQAALTNATLQGAYFMIAARAHGLDVGPLGGFDRDRLDAAFFPDGRYASIWIVNLGYGDDAKIRPRNPRFAFKEIATFV